MNDTPTTNIGSLKSSLIVGGIALAIVIVLFIVLGTRGGSETGSAPHDESVPHGHDADGNPVPIVTGDQPHDESVPHSHSPAPGPAPVVVPSGEPHNESVPHKH